MTRSSRLFLTCLASVLGLGVSVRADVVTDWNELTLGIIRADTSPPTQASRLLAIVHVAIYDAVNAIEQTHEPYVFSGTADANASREAAAATAAQAVLLALAPAHETEITEVYHASLVVIQEGDAKQAGIAVGQAAAAAILAARADDGAADTVPYTPGTEPGDWQPTPPAFAPPHAPQWRHVTPFAMSVGSQFRGEGPPALTSPEYAAAFEEAKSLGKADSSVRSEEQTEIARYWVNGPGTSTPAGHWNRIAQLVATNEGNSLTENARLFALLNIALADAGIVSWDNKYAYNHWRPVTAIPDADLDGNPDTEADVAWLPFLPTPAFPEYTSGHSTFSGAASKVLELFFGSDNAVFTLNSDGTPAVFRTFGSFSEAADESGRSRIYGGIHWEYSNRDGLGSGRLLGVYVAENFLVEAEPDGDGDGDGEPLICGILDLANLVLLFTSLTALKWRTWRGLGS